MEEEGDVHELESEVVEEGDEEEDEEEEAVDEDEDENFAELTEFCSFIHNFD